MRDIIIAVVLAGLMGLIIPTRVAADGVPESPPSGGRPASSIGKGIHIADLSRLEQAEALGFEYVKVFLAWANSEPSKGVYSWEVAPRANDVDNIARAFAGADLKLVLRVDTPPAWAAPGSGNRPPSDPADYGDFMAALASYLRGQVVAYELWNEPNLSIEWGGLPPDPAGFAALLCDAYPKIKAQDPDAIVIAGGLASTNGDGGSTSTNDLAYLRALYAAGARGCFDVLGSHPYGFASPPEVRTPQTGLDFRRAADQRWVMVEHGDADKPMWATEMGWLIDPAAYDRPHYVKDESWAGRAWQAIEPMHQADYLVRAFRYAEEHWPWMEVMIVFNLDFSTVYWYHAAEHMRFYALLNPDGTPRPAYTALRQYVSAPPWDDQADSLPVADAGDASARTGAGTDVGTGGSSGRADTVLTKEPRDGPDDRADRGGLPSWPRGHACAPPDSHGPAGISGVSDADRSDCGDRARPR